jgi:hypothetical protein
MSNEPSNAGNSKLDKPHALTVASQKTIVESLAEGNFLVVACRRAGLSVRPYYYWRKLLEAGAEHAGVYREFYAACDKASAVAEMNALAAIRAGMPGWQGSSWFLERRFPTRWGRKAEITLRGIPADLSALTDEQLEALERSVSGRR